MAGTSANRATPVDRAGLTDVFAIGPDIRMIAVRHKPIAIGANPPGVEDDVALRITKMKKPVRIISEIMAANKL